MGLAALGCLSSALVTGPSLFILARGVVGMGYGLAILAAQAYTVGCGKLSDMLAGVYAGSLCGSAMGAILAERLGYAPVFLGSSVALFCLLALPRFLLGADCRPCVSVRRPCAGKPAGPDWLKILDSSAGLPHSLPNSGKGIPL